MLSGVLSSETAIKVNIQIMRVFAWMRKMIDSHDAIFSMKTFDDNSDFFFGWKLTAGFSFDFLNDLLRTSFAFFIHFFLVLKLKDPILNFFTHLVQISLKTYNSGYEVTFNLWYFIVGYLGILHVVLNFGICTERTNYINFFNYWCWI